MIICCNLILSFYIYCGISIFLILKRNENNFENLRKSVVWGKLGKFRVWLIKERGIIVCSRCLKNEGFKKLGK